MSIKTGLPYGWWKSPDVWALTICGVPSIAICLILLAGWFS